MHAQQVELGKMFGHVPGVSMELPMLTLVEVKEERGRLHNTGSDMIYENVFKPYKNKFFPFCCCVAQIRIKSLGLEIWAY